ncbi:carbohydrate-binding protein [Streptomyces sp. NPDC047130]|uniref:carbohydrate-binding protein n=1 Tax=Streptomyces sp. NPDC047130 TaxID=3155261 RepID=UPI0034103C5F
MPPFSRVTGTAALLAAGTLLLSGLAGTATARPTVPPRVDSPSAAETLRTDRAPAGLLKALQRDLGLTAGQAERRLVNEAEAGATLGRLRLALGADHAGGWIGGADAGALTVATTDRSDVAVIERAGARAVVVDRSLGELEADRARLDRAAGKVSAADVPVRYVDLRRNKVVVEAVDPAAAGRLVAAAGVDPSHVEVVRTAERPRTYYDVRGGDAYYMGGGGRCSVGFGVTRSTTQGFVTAGHCGTVGRTTSGYNQVAQGTFQGSTFPGRDMAWVAVNSNWTATATVVSSSQQVAGSTQAAVGASICRSGSTTGWRCGTVQQHNTSVTYPEGTVSGVTRTSVCAEPGDSGGSFISGSQAQGVTSGGSGNCSSGGTTYYYPVNPILSSYGLTLKTAGGTTPPPTTPPPTDPGATTWTPGVVYQAGATVTYDGVSYRCLQQHQAQGGWEPPNVPALWQRVA